MKVYSTLTQLNSLREDEEYLEFEVIAISATCVKRPYGELCFTEEVLQKYATFLIGKPVCLDHKAEVSSIIGAVIDSRYDESQKAIIATVKIPKTGNEKLVYLLKLIPSPLKSVSIAALLETEKKENGKLMVTSIDFKEISLVFEGADPNAKILSKCECEKFSTVQWWDDPELREKAPREYFLDPSGRRYPYKTWDGRVSCERLKAAMSLAGLHGHSSIYQRAKALYEKHCKKEE